MMSEQHVVNVCLSFIFKGSLNHSNLQEAQLWEALRQSLFSDCIMHGLTNKSLIFGKQKHEHGSSVFFLWDSNSYLSSPDLILTLQITHTYV